MTDQTVEAAVTVDGHDETTTGDVALEGDRADADPARAGTPGVDELADLARTVLIGEGVAAGHLDLILVDPEPMAELNQEHLGHQGPTDVLSFPLDGPDQALGAAVGGPPMPSAPPAHLGDVVVCPAVAVEQAPNHAGTVEAELALLVIHGVLHVLGHDHAEPAETELMQSRERHHLAQLGFEHPIPVAGVGEGR